MVKLDKKLTPFWFTYITFLAQTPLGYGRFSLVKLNRLTLLDFAVQKQDNINVNKQGKVSITRSNKKPGNKSENVNNHL